MNKILTAYHLKIIAAVTMVIDHVGLIFLPDIWIFRIVGRTAFVLYAFMLVEGYMQTNNFKKYLDRIIMFGMISEIPYDLAVYGKLFYIESQNIFFTLAIGLICMRSISRYKTVFKRIILAIIAMFVAYVLRVDYSWYGVLLILIFYFLRQSNLKYVSAEVASIVAASKLLALQVFAFIGFIPILLYNGKRGRKMGSWYYWFYAAHLFMFYVIKTIKASI